MRIFSWRNNREYLPFAIQDIFQFGVLDIILIKNSDT